MESGNRSVAISTSSILKIILVLLGILFAWAIRDVLVIVLVSFILAAAMNPTITSFQRRGIPRWVGIALIYVGLLAILGLLVVLVIPLVTDELAQLIRAFPTLYAKAFTAVQGSDFSSTIEKGLGSLNSALSQFTSGFFNGVASFFGGVFAVIGVLVLTFYLTIQEKGMKSVLVDISPVKYRPYLTRLFNRIEERLGQWLRGQLLLGAIIAAMIYLALFVLGVKYALVLALLAGVTELIPIVGPYIGGLPAVIVALSQSPWLALSTVIAYIVVQQLESHLIVPRVMGRVTGLNPIIVIVAVLTGAKIGGITGVLFAVPTVIIITSFIDDFTQEQKENEARVETA